MPVLNAVQLRHCTVSSSYNEGLARMPALCPSSHVPMLCTLWTVEFSSRVLEEETQLEWAAIYYSGGLPIEASNPHLLHLPHWQAGALTYSSHSEHELTGGQWQETHFPKGKGLIEKTFSSLLKQIALYRNLTIQGKYS